MPNQRRLFRPANADQHFAQRLVGQRLVGQRLVGGSQAAQTLTGGSQAAQTLTGVSQADQTLSKLPKRYSAPLARASQRFVGALAFRWHAANASKRWARQPGVSSRPSIRLTARQRARMLGTRTCRNAWNVPKRCPTKCCRSGFAQAGEPVNVSDAPYESRTWLRRVQRKRFRGRGEGAYRAAVHSFYIFITEIERGPRGATERHRATPSGIGRTYHWIGDRGASA
jgi:hypothetical protein